MTVTTGVVGPTQAVLRHADGVELIGEMAGSGYRVPPSLVRRADGQTIQLTPLLYAILREVDGRRTPEELAEAVSEATGRTVNEDNIRHLVDKQLRPFGLLVQEDGSQPITRKRNPLLALRFRYAVTDPDRTRRLTDPFRFLFRPWMAVPILAAFVVVCWWVFFRKGLAHAAYDAFQRPGLLILVFAITILSAGFHEFGHAAAARYGGATPGVMGFGVYLVWPAFYTDVTDTYRLGRRGRVRTDLGGLYFNAIVAVVITGLWWWVHYDALLLVVATQILQMLRQLAPMVRFDGYHVLADITGVPDLYSRIKPTLLGLLPWRWGDPHARLLKPWARILVTVWVMVVVPMLLSALAGAILAVPRLTGSAWSAIGKQQDVLSTAWADGDMIQATARVLAIIAIVIPVAGVLYMFVRIARQSAVGAWKGTVGKPVMRTLAILLGATIVTGIAYAWWPGEGKYRPIQPWERGTVGDIAYALGVERMSGPRHATGAPRPAAASRALVKGQQGVMRAVWDTRTPPPTFTQPQLAVILVPKAVPGARVGGGGGWFPAATTTEDKGWVFPFDKPLTPGPDDTQALAVNTTDNTVDYEAAFAMIWVKDNSDAMNINDAEAYASCNSCGAVAVSYQVVFVLDTDDADNNVAAPENLAGALNYNCVNCLTYALAQQLFITLDRPLTEDEMKALDDVWAEMRDYEEQIKDGKVPLDEIDDHLAAYTNRIKTIVAPAIASTTAPSTAVQTASQTSPPTVSSTVAPAPSMSSTAIPTPSSTESPAASSTASPTATSSASPTTASSAPTGTTSGPTPSSGSTSTGTATDGSATGGSTASDGTASGGSTSGGTAASP